MVKSLSLNEIRSRASEFVVNWRDSPGDERQDGQSFLRDLLTVYGITETRAALYEKRAQRSSTGRQGYIDALIPGLLIVELKSVGKDLGIAEIQALDYMQDLPDSEQPRYVLSSDFKKFRLLDLHAPGGSDTSVFSLEELPVQAERLAFLAGYQTRSFGSAEQEQASVKAAKIMAKLYEALEGSGYTDHEASLFLVRTLFALYADDSGVWERDIFTEFLDQRTSVDGSDLGSQLTQLYQTMNQPLDRRPTTLDEGMARFPYVNGRVFEESLSIPSFSRNMRDQLLKAAAFDWREISPAIFGSLFQSVKSPEARRALGEHYTTETNILKTLGPLFLDELKERFAAAHHDVPGLKKLRAELSEIKVMDPACGSGNFLIVAYRELRQLELDILLRLDELGDTSIKRGLFFERDDLAVKLNNFAGIEIEEFPARIAQTAMRLVDHQANMAMQLALGMAPDTLPLDTIEIIHTGNALTLDWREIMAPENCVRVVGNPPFLGHASRTPAQADELRTVWERKDIGRLDYVTGWFKKAIDYFQVIPGGRFSFVSTSSIAQGEPVPALFGPIFKAGWRIRFAHQTFAWTSEAAGAASVHCVITGFDKEPHTPAKLYSYSTLKGEPTEVPVLTRINAYLADGAEVLVRQRRDVLGKGLPPVTMGSMPRDGGNLLINSRQEYEEVCADAIAAKYVRPFLMGKEFINGIERWCLWLVELNPSDVARSPELKRRLSKVAEMRRASSAKSTQEMAAIPHLFGQRSQPELPYMAIPAVFSQARPFATVAHLPPEVIAGNKVYTAKDPDGFAFTIASSSMFITWQKTVGGRLKSDPNFSNTLVWNTLPLPRIDDVLRQQVLAVGQGVLDARGLRPERSLAAHYNPLAMSPELLKAHAALDRVVDRAFGAGSTLRSNEERLPILFERYQEMTALQR